MTYTHAKVSKWVLTTAVVTGMEPLLSPTWRSVVTVRQALKAVDKQSMFPFVKKSFSRSDGRSVFIVALPRHAFGKEEKSRSKQNRMF